ncbi:MAG: PD-(D/E)XK nuclease family protein [Acidimicrobiia bacterium]|nr:PD-(D/E)XK nuclease family protein [Acidimicrobiia bacterium]
MLRLWTPTPGQDGWATDRPLRLSVADLVRGDRRERVVELRTDAGWLGDWLDERVATVHALAAEGTARPGTECGFCRFFSGCPAHEHGANRSAPRGDLRPGVIALTPSSLDRWIACPRAWRARHLLGLPESDGGGSPDRGLLTHDLLRLVHTGGSCQDDGHVEDVLRAHHVAGPGPIRDHLCAHRRRCPIGAEALGHEVEVARFHRDPLLAFVATARIDAAWVHDGLLDARDYKTGTVRYPRVSDDPRARLQAWVLAPRAAARGLRLRVRYEHLAPEVDDDPDPFDPEEDDLAAIEEELRDVVAAIRADDPFGGVADARTCRHCGYRSICPQSAAPGEPTWPAVEAPDDEEGGGAVPVRFGWFVRPRWPTLAWRATRPEGAAHGGPAHPRRRRRGPAEPATRRPSGGPRAHRAARRGRPGGRRRHGRAVVARGPGGHRGGRPDGLVGLPRPRGAPGPPPRLRAPDDAHDDHGRQQPPDAPQRPGRRDRRR